MSELKRSAVDFREPRTILFTALRGRGELPHLYKEGGSYFITFRLWDAVTQLAEARRWQELQSLVVQPARLRSRELAREIAQATEPPLELGSRILRRAQAAALVQNALLYFEMQRYQLAAWCVMPNHVHVAYTALGAHSPADIHHSWKSYTAHRINKRLGRRGALWERESFDHLIRSVEHYEAYVAYIEHNPVAAGLCARPEQWPFSSAAYFRR
jgi:REP element-mobilizing transposase RayT